METNVVCEHFEITPSIQEHVAHHLDILDPLIPNAAKMTLFLVKQNKNMFRTLFRVCLRGRVFVASAENSNFYVALNKAAWRFENKLKHRLDRRHNYRRKSHREGDFWNAFFSEVAES